jgi:transcriptional regulator with XRE-family HTH domain
MTHSVTEAIAANVRAEAARHRTDQDAVATHLGLSTSSVSRRFSGERPFAVADLVRLAAWWDISISKLLGDQLKELA